MPQDKNKEIRFYVLDRCFADRNNYYFWEKLQEACQEALFNAGMEHPTVSRRTIMNDIREMESNSHWQVELLPPEKSRDGKRRYYRYADPNYSIWKIDLNEEQLLQLKSILLMLRQFEGFPQYDAIEDIIEQLEKKYKFTLGDTAGIMAFETNDNPDAIRHIARLFSAIVNKEVLSITYKPFDMEQYTMLLHPYYLKQYNRRWFCFGFSPQSNRPLDNLALDRIKCIETSSEKYIECQIDWVDYFEDLMGVTQSNDEVQRIVLEFEKDRFPYVISKPLHPSQRIIDKAAGRIEIQVKPTKELYQRLLSFGADVEVISPAFIRQRMQEKVQKMMQKYEPVQKPCTEQL